MPDGRCQLKRTRALMPLSHDHQHGLAVALQLRRSRNPPADRERLLAFFDSEGERHFRVEEQVVLGFVAEELPDTDPDVARVLRDHEELRRRVRALRRTPSPSAVDLRETGDLLNAHIRHEERVLFPRIERILDQTRLDELGRLLADAETQPG